MKAKTYQIWTLGCKVNQYESQVVREVFESEGIQPAAEHCAPDYAVINTCAVTSEAVRKSKRVAKRMGRNGRTAIAVIGCAAAAEGDAFRAVRGVKRVLSHEVDVSDALREWLRHETELDRATAGPHSLGISQPGFDRPARQRDEKNEGQMRPDNGLLTPEDPNSAADSYLSISHGRPNVKNPLRFDQRIHRFDDHQRAFLKVQDGCDAFCTYCIIPRLRRLVRSKPIADVLDEAGALIRAGHREIILSGIFLGAYGQNTALRRRFEPEREGLAGLIRALSTLEGLERLRLSSLEPGDVTPELLSAIASNPVCVPQLHLPLQSGSERILRKMNRQYNVDDFVDMMDRVRSALNQPAITTDIIAGFPGETEEDFAASLKIARWVPFLKIHAFPFSPRQGTAAARWTEDFVPASVVADRMARLAAVEAEGSLAYRRGLVGRGERVIVEQIMAAQTQTRAWGGAGGAADGEAALCCGRSDRFFEIHFEGKGIRVGDVMYVRIDEATPGRTRGTPVRASRLSLPVAGSSP